MHVEAVIFPEPGSEDDKAQLVYRPTTAGDKFAVACGRRSMGEGLALTLDGIDLADAVAIQQSNFEPLSKYIEWSPAEPKTNRVIDPERTMPWLRTSVDSALHVSDGIIREGLPAELAPVETTPPNSLRKKHFRRLGLLSLALGN